MKISYVNHVRGSQESDTIIPPKQLKHSMLMAIKHQNIDLIEPLISKGTPLIEPLSNGKSALINACDVGNELIIEKLLIRSMRSFTLYPSSEVLYTLEYLFSKRLYRIIDLTFFSIKQSVESMQKYGRFIEAVEALEKLGDPEEKERHEKFLAVYKEVIASIGFRKDFYYYLFYVWKKIDTKLNQNALELYQLLSEAFEKEQLRVSNAALLAAKGRLSWNIMTSSIITALIIIQLFVFIPWKALSLALSSGIFVILAGIFWSLIKEYHALAKNIHESRQEQLFLKHAREGDYAAVSTYLESDKHVNVMEGVAESTPLREAERMGHENIKVLLRKFGAFSAEGSRTISFPQ
jgi:ankyrin repeat protein